MSLEKFQNLTERHLNALNHQRKDYNKKLIEIIHAGKLLMLLESNFKILKVNEKPDFIIKHGDKSIGLEHEILVDQRSKLKEGTFDDLVRNIEQKFKEAHPDTKLLIRMWLNPNLKISKSDKPELIEKCLSIVEDHIYYNRFIENDLIRDISVLPHSKLILWGGLGAWWQRKLDSEILESSITKKESKIDSYITNTAADEQWLLIVIGGIGGSSYVVDQGSEIEFNKESKFDKIFLLDEFRSKYFEIK